MRWWKALGTLVFLAAAQALGVEAAPAAPKPTSAPTILVLPLKTSGLSDLGFSLSLRIEGALRAAGGSNLVHPKMLASVERRYDHRLQSLDAQSRRRFLGSILGAEYVVHGTLGPDEKSIRLALSPVRPKSPSLTRLVRAESFRKLLLALPDGVLSLAETAKVLKNIKRPTPDLIAPSSLERQALLDYAACHRAMIRQPLGVSNPIVVDQTAVRLAMERCRAAVALDEGFESPMADLALGHAFLGEQKEAERILIGLKTSTRFHPTYWLARFWVLSRFYDAGLALENLREAISIDPGFMLARGYLGEALVALQRPRDAIKVFEEYLERCPRQSYVMGQLGYAHSKDGDATLAIDWTKKALKETPGDPELLVQMGSRLIDAERYPPAISILSRVIGEGGARGEVYLRLGYAHMMNGDFSEAEQMIRQAISKARGPAEWRTRGRARYSLAQLWLRSGSPKNAIRQLRQAMLEGYHDEKALSSPALAAVRDHPDFMKLRKTKPRPGAAPEYVSPLGRATSSASLEPRGVLEKKRNRRILDRL